MIPKWLLSWDSSPRTAASAKRPRCLASSCPAAAPVRQPLSRKHGSELPRELRAAVEPCDADAKEKANAFLEARRRRRTIGSCLISIYGC